LSELKLLQSLDVSHNLLKELPESVFPNLKRLKTLNVSHNPKLKKLAKSVGHCHSIQTLLGPDPEVVQYPPANIVKQGTEQTMRFLAKGKHNLHTDTVNMQKVCIKDLVNLKFYVMILGLN
jgi:hypothetical protein